MAYQSSMFLVFLVVVFAAWAAIHRWNAAGKALLLVASLVFYASWGLHCVGLLLGVIAFNYGAGLLLGWLTTAPRARRRLILVLAIVGNVAFLALFKYQRFFVDIVQSILPVHLPVLQVVVPVGISFYIFQVLSYVIDVYQRTIKPCKNPVDFALFVAFFPKLLLGPLVRPGEFLAQLGARRTLGAGNFSQYLPLFAAGLFKKLILADNLGLFVDPVFANLAAASSLDCMLAVPAYAFQIYYDFSGCTDIALGVAALFGYALPQNFNAPYLATSITDFWRRWHMSLTTWLRNYLFLPVAYAVSARLPQARYCGIKAENIIYCVATLVTMTVCGFWHGAGWTFVLWGLYQGVAMSVERFVLKSGRDKCLPLAVALWRWAITVVLMLSGWLLFRVQKLTDVGAFFSAVAKLQFSTTLPRVCAVILVISCVYTVARFIMTRSGYTLAIPATPWASFAFGVAKGACAILLLLFALVFSCGVTVPFIYLQF